MTLLIAIVLLCGMSIATGMLIGYVEAADPDEGDQ